MKRILLCLSVIISGCSHYRSIQPNLYSGKRHIQKITFESCTNYFFGIPNEPKNLTLAKALDDHQLTPEQIFSVDTKSWIWTWPIYSWQCLEINMNQSYASKTTNILKETAPQTTQSPSKQLSDEPGSVSGNLKHDLGLCEKLNKKEAATCKKLIKRQYESLEKIN